MEPQTETELCCVFWHDTTRVLDQPPRGQISWAREVFPRGAAPVLGVSIRIGIY